jgi:hypothetical protein
MKRTARGRRKSSENIIWIDAMKRHRKPAPAFAVCIDNSEYTASLELHKIYRALPDEEASEDGDLRVIDESGEDYLYKAEYFMMLELPREVQQALLHAS